MPKFADVPVLSGIPTGYDRPVPADADVCFVDVLDVLTRHLTPALCETVFRQTRKNERERKWTLTAVAQFWTAMIIRQPPSLHQGLDRTRRRSNKDIWPRVMAEPQAFFQKCADLRADFFEALFEKFTESLGAFAEPAYASWMKSLRKDFSTIQIIDGSKLDLICHRLKILWPVRAPVLPGSMIVVYDLFTGIARQACFDSHAHANERGKAPKFIEKMQPGTLLMGDRLYCLLQLFSLLAERRAHGLFRLNGQLKIKRLEILSTKQDGRMLLEDVLVEVGAGGRYACARLRLIRYRYKKCQLDLLTDVLNPEKLPAETAVKLYGMRWSIERMFLDLKKTLKLHCLYAAHPNLVAQQLFATLMVYNAFRASQSAIAVQAGVLPEQISAQKLFPKLGQAAHDYAFSQWHSMRIRQLNPGIDIAFPDPRTIPSAKVRLKAILAQRRIGSRRPTRPSSSQPKSFGHIRGGTALMATVTDG